MQVACLRELSKQDIIQFYKSFIAAGDTRRKLSCHVVSTCEGGAATCDTGAATEPRDCRHVSDITGFKSSLPLYPLMTPHVELKELQRPVKK